MLTNVPAVGGFDFSTTPYRSSEEQIMMRSKTQLLLAGACALALAPSAFAQVNGTMDAGEYGPALVLQTTPTGFGNNFSELNGLYAKIFADGSIRLMFTGNLEGNGNGLVVFVDSTAAGSVATDLGGGFGRLGSVAGEGFSNRSSKWGIDWDNTDAIDLRPGSVLSGGFNPERSLEINQSGNTNYFLNVVDMTLVNQIPATVPGYDDRATFIPDPLDNTRTGVVNGAATTGTLLLQGAAQVNAGSITTAFNNNNILGVNGYDFGSPPGPLGDPSDATTGFEIEMSAFFINSDPGQEMRIFPYITNQGGDFLANQFLPGLPGGNLSNLGGLGDIGGDPMFDAQLLPGYNTFITLPTAEWGGASGSQTSNDANWILANPNGVNVTAKFGTAAATTLVNLDAAKTLGGMIFDNSSTAYTISGASTLTLEAFSGKQARINVRSGNHSITAPVQVNGNLRLSAAASSSIELTNVSYLGFSVTKDGAGSVKVNRVIASALNVAEGRLQMSHIRAGANTSSAISVTIAGATDAWTSTLDTNANDLVIDYIGATPLATVQNQLKSGYNSGAWTGTGITSAAAATAAATADKTAIGYADNTDTIRLVYTLSGDATLDGTVNSGDFNLLATNFGGTGKVWGEGDFTYDGNANSSDFNALASNFGKTLATGPGGSVPEPGALSLLAAGSLLALRRRR